MKQMWPQLRLGDVLCLDLNPIRVIPGESYDMVGVYSFGRGLFPREALDGANTSYRFFYRLKCDHIVMSQLFGWEGALALASKEYEGRYVSPQFPTFLCSPERLDRAYLGWLIRRPSFWKELGSRTRGMGDRRRTLNPEALLNITISLPPLNEQRRIVARIEDLYSKIEEACLLHKEAASEAEALSISQVGKVFSRLETTYKPRNFGSFYPHVTSGPRNWAKHYKEDGLRFYRAQDIGPAGKILNGSKMFIEPPPGEQGRSAMLQCGDLMLVITGATVGRVSMYRKGLESGFVSQHVGICRLPQSEVEPEFALWGLRGPSGQAQLLGQRYGQGKPGLNLSNIRSLSLPFPPLPEQSRIVAYLDDLQAKVDAIKRLNEDTTAELEALMPSILSNAFSGEL